MLPAGFRHDSENYPEPRRDLRTRGLADTQLFDLWLSWNDLMISRP